MEIVTKAMFRLPAQIHFCYGMSRLNPDWFLVWTAKTHMKAISANQIHTTFGGHCDTQWWHQIQRDRCSLDWETTHRTVRRQSLSNKLLAPQLHNMNVGKVQEHATNHTDRLVLSGTQNPIWSLANNMQNLLVSDVIWETNWISLQSEYSQSNRDTEHPHNHSNSLTRVGCRQQERGKMERCRLKLHHAWK